VVSPDGGFIVENLPGVAGGDFTRFAVDSVLPGFGNIFITTALFFFTYTTVLAYAMYLNSCAAFLTKGDIKGDRYKKTVFIINLLIVLSVFAGSLAAADTVWNFASATMGIQAVLVPVCLFFLAKPVRNILKDYEDQKKREIVPVFIPDNCGIKDAELWNSIIPNNYPEEYQAYKDSYKE